MHHHGQQIMDYVAAHEWGVPVKISDERAALLDTGGGLRQALPLFQESEAPVLIHNVDILSDAPLADFLCGRTRGGCAADGEPTRHAALFVVQ